MERQGIRNIIVKIVRSEVFFSLASFLFVVLLIKFYLAKSILPLFVLSSFAIVSFILIFISLFRIKDAKAQKFLFYLLIISSFLGSGFFAYNIGPFSIFASRIVFVIIFILLMLDIILKGKLRIKKVKIRNFLMFLLLWLCYGILSLIWADDKVNAIRQIIFLFIGIFLVLFSVYYLNRLEDFKKFYIIWAVILVPLIGIGIWEHLTGNHLPISGYGLPENVRAKYMPSGFYNNTNDLAMHLSLSFAFIFAWIHYAKRRFLEWPIAFGIIIAGFYVLYYTSSRANFFAVIVEVVVMSFLVFSKLKKQAKVFYGIIVLFTSFIALILFNLNEYIYFLKGTLLSDSSDSVRLNIIKNGLLSLYEHYGMGVGAGNFEYHLSNFGVYDTQGIINAHNWWAEILVNYGIFIFVAYVMFYVGIIANLWKFYGKIIDISEKRICEALFVSLVGFFFASISSSSIIALNVQWILFAFALSFLNYMRVKNYKLLLKK